MVFFLSQFDYNSAETISLLVATYDCTHQTPPQQNIQSKTGYKKNPWYTIQHLSFETKHNLKL